TGLLYEHGDDEGLAARLLSLMEDEGRAHEIGETGRLFVKANFSGERSSEEMKRLYRELLGLKGRSAEGVESRALVEDV
ncbi:MAG TPA: hypothetical protein VEV81_12125, partial [Pyrinomonadaceae bacterium]|nr:hypothetical protein [Pyrinomonadaceae bacterium]